MVLSKVHWDRVGGAGNAIRIGYYPFSSLCRDRDFWLRVTIVGLMSRQELVCLGVFGCRQGFSGSRQSLVTLCRDMVFLVS